MVDYDCLVSEYAYKWRDEGSAHVLYIKKTSHVSTIVGVVMIIAAGCLVGLLAGSRPQGISILAIWVLLAFCVMISVAGVLAGAYLSSHNAREVARVSCDKSLSILDGNYTIPVESVVRIVVLRIHSPPRTIGGEGKPTVISTDVEFVVNGGLQQAQCAQHFAGFATTYSISEVPKYVKTMQALLATRVDIIVREV